MYSINIAMLQWTVAGLRTLEEARIMQLAQQVLRMTALLHSPHSRIELVIILPPYA